MTFVCSIASTDTARPGSPYICFFYVLLLRWTLAPSSALYPYSVPYRIGRQLPGHQGPPGCDLQDCGQHDQGQDSRGDPQDVQHQERLHADRGGAGAQGERVVRGEVDRHGNTESGGRTQASFIVTWGLRERVSAVRALSKPLSRGPEQFRQLSCSPASISELNEGWTWKYEGVCAFAVHMWNVILLSPGAPGRSKERRGEPWLERGGVLMAGSRPYHPGPGQACAVRLSCEARLLAFVWRFPAG